MSDPWVMTREILTIEGGRTLYVYSFEESPEDSEGGG